MEAVRCIVPNCTNTANSAIPFPIESKLRKKWLESLEIPDFVPGEQSFICLNHFSDTDALNNISDSEFENVLEELPLPVRPECANKTNESQTINDGDRKIIDTMKKNIQQKLFGLKKEEHGPSTSTVQRNSDSVNEIHNYFASNSPVLVPNNLRLVCRLCMTTENVCKYIFDVFDTAIRISYAITTCMPAIKISKNDGLSKIICMNCLETIKQFYKFRETCLDSDQKQRHHFKQKAEKRNILNERNEVKAKRICTMEEQKSTSVPKPVVPLKSKDILPTTRKYQRVEEELLMVLQGKMIEMKGSDSIIIEIQSDEESEEPQAGTSQQSDQKGVTVEEILPKEDKMEVVEVPQLPKGIKVSKTQPRTGDFNLSQVPEIESSNSYCLIDNYVFEYRLCKGNTRYLKCAESKCKGAAQQSCSELGYFDNKVVVTIGHNHPPPSPEERKKTLFLQMMRRKLQSDKSLNFRTVYEEFCQKDPEMRRLVPLKTVINQICCQQMNLKSPPIFSFYDFYDMVENDEFQKLHFTHSNKQFYQERLTAKDGSKAVIFADCNTISTLSNSKIMYVDSSFKVDTFENFKYHLVTVLVWIADDSSRFEPVVQNKRKITFECFQYYPIMFALVNQKTQEVYKTIFRYLHDSLAPNLRPDEIVTDYEANLYYSLAEIYLESHIGGSVFYYTQNIYKKVCSLNLSRELETNSSFRNIYHMILMLPLLPVNTIIDGLENIESQAEEMGQGKLTAPIFDYVKSEWINKVTPELFCVHRLESRINENVMAPFKKLRDFLMLSKGKMYKQKVNIVSVVEKLIDLEGFLSTVNTAPAKKSFARDLSSSQKRSVIRAWNFIESHPKININNFFTKVLGYIKCMENQLWIWGFYRYTGEANDDLINAANFSIVSEVEQDWDDEKVEYVDYVYPEEGVEEVIGQEEGSVEVQTAESYVEDVYME